MLSLRKKKRTTAARLGHRLALSLIVALVFPACKSVSPAKMFDVRNFGATGDGSALDTSAIQKAFDECGKSGGGIVRFSRGIYRSQPLFLRDKTVMQLDDGAVLKATDDPVDFRKPEQNNTNSLLAFINAENLTDIAITGQGTIDGAGERWWVPAEAARRKKEGYALPRPRLVVLSHCKNVRIEGVTLANSPMFHLVPVECEDVVIDHVTITAPAGSPNTDGIDPSLSRRVRISNCRIDVGDDNIAIKSGHRIPERPFGCEDITVSDCVFLHGHGMSIGSETKGGVRNLLVERCSFTDTANGIRIKSARDRGGAVQNLTYHDITMTNVNPALTIVCYYPHIPKEDAAQPVTPETPIFQNIRISNLSATCPRGAGIITGLPESPVTGVLLENVRISAATGFTIRNAKAIQLKNVEVKVEQGSPFELENAEVNGLEK